MKYNVLRGFFYAIILVSVSWSSLTLLMSLYTIEIDEVSTCSYIVDGDTFDILTGERIRLADIDTPERGEWGYHEASNALSSMIFNRKVYLDIDDVSWTDRYGRLVCLVYIDFNTTHYLNVNEALLVTGYADVWDHPNEFIPSLWTIFVPKLGTSDMLKLLLVSIGIGLGATVFIHFILRAIWRTLPFKSRIK